MNTIGKYETELKNGAKEINYYVNCFDRWFTIIFDSSLPMNELPKIYEKLEENYYKWHEDDNGWCCEEFMIENLDEETKEKIVTIIYNREEEK